MSFVTIMLFFIYTYGLGFTATGFLPKIPDFFERNIMRVGIGLGIFVVLGVILNLLYIPIDWRFFLLASTLYPLIYLAKKLKSKKLNIDLKFKVTKSNLISISILLIFSLSLYMYVGGAFSYPYLEDDDSWSHVLSVNYVATEKTLNSPENHPFQYLGPYPPGYPLIMGVLHQTSPSVSWTLKFFNSLFLSLGLLFFYFFAKRFMGNEYKALFATFILAVIPSFFTHFIWAHSLVVTLFFPAIYCLEMINSEN